MNPQTFSPADFAKALASDGLRQPVVLTGMVKKAEHPDAILFSPERTCRIWVPIPLDKIEKVEWLGKVPCTDHVHDLVRLYLKDAGKDDGGFYAELLRAFLSQPVVPGFGGADQPAPGGMLQFVGPAGATEGIPMVAFAGPIGSPAAPPISTAQTTMQVMGAQLPATTRYVDYAGSPYSIEADAAAAYTRCNSDHNNQCVKFGPVYGLWYVRYPVNSLLREARCSVPGSAGPFFCHRVNSAYQCAITCQQNGYRCYAQWSDCCPSDEPWGCYCNNNCPQEAQMSTFTNYVATCTFYCSGGGSITTSGSGTSPAAARTAAENNAVLQGCTIIGYGNCTITP